MSKLDSKVKITIDGKEYQVRFTLGVLADLEGALEVEGVSAVIDKVSSGSAKALAKILSFGIVGLTEDEILKSDVSHQDCLKAVNKAMCLSLFGSEEPPKRPLSPETAPANGLGMQFADEGQPSA